MFDHGDYQPGSFVYTTLSKNRTLRGSWKGYIVTRMPYIFLFGLCVEGEDASYFLLRPHPDKKLSNTMLVGIQSLLLSHPTAKGEKYGVSRQIVAVKNPVNSQTLDVAHDWIKKYRHPVAGGLLVNLEDVHSEKT